MTTSRFSLLALAAMAVFLVATLLFSLPRQAPDAAKARYDFVRAHRDATVESVDLDTIAEDVIAFRVRYWTFASNERKDEVLLYNYEKDKGWVLK